MKRILAFAVVLAFASVTLAGAEARDCIDDRKCRSDESPPSCCRQPPCELFKKLASRKAMVRMLESDNAREALQATEGNFDEALAMLRRTKPKEPTKSCDPTPERYPEPRFLEVEDGPRCRIGTIGPGGSGWVELSWGDVQDRSKTCVELEDAQFERLLLAQKWCLSRQQSGSTALDDFYSMQEGYQKEADRLTEQLLEYWKACSNTADIKTSLDMLSLGIDELEKDAAAQPPPKLPRSSRGGGGAR